MITGTSCNVPPCVVISAATLLWVVTSRLSIATPEFMVTSISSNLAASATDTVRAVTVPLASTVAEAPPEVTLHIAKVKELVSYANAFSPTEQEAKVVLSYYGGLHREEGLYNF